MLFQTSQPCTHMFLVGRVPIFGPFPPATAVAGYNPIRRIKGDARFIASTKVAKRDGEKEIRTCLRRIALDGLACPFRGLVVVALIDERPRADLPMKPHVGIAPRECNRKLALPHRKVGVAAEIVRTAQRYLCPRVVRIELDRLAPRSHR